ncbi:MAG: flagellar hook-length control protein FliK [Synergistaceae bacterium]|nr:flagellar hook-length control protein FliK [Synergistaceae bacterium]
MSTDLLTFVQSQVNTQTPANMSNQDSQNLQAEIDSGLFENLMAEFISPEAEEQNIELLVPEGNNHLMTFKGNNSFSQSVINLLAGNENENNEGDVNVNLTENQEELEIIWDEDNKDIEMPVNEEVTTDKENLVISRNISDSQVRKDEKPDETEEIKTEDDENKIDDNAEELTSENAMNVPIFAGIVEVNNNAVSEVEGKNENPKISTPYAKHDKNIKSQTQNAQQNIHIDSENEHENSQTEKKLNFGEELKNQEAESGSEKNIFNGHEHNNNHDSGQKSNNGQNGQKIQAKNQNEKSSTLSNSQRIEAHDSFQNFFESVVNNRRTVSQNSPLPLNLRAGNVNFTPSQTLREGLVNTVRFIRADGVQKANIIVDPPALGRISVELTSSSSGVEASIKVANEQIRQLVQDQISQLRMNLSDQGVQVAEFTVDVQQDNHFGGQGQGQNNSQEENGRRDFVREISSEDTEEFNIDLEEGLLYWVA